jgi:hypothetical protein
LLRIIRRWPGAVQSPQQGIQTLLYAFTVAAFATQFAEQLGDHLFENGRIVGKKRGVG